MTTTCANAAASPPCDEHARQLGDREDEDEVEEELERRDARRCDPGRAGTRAHLRVADRMRGPDPGGFDPLPSATLPRRPQSGAADGHLAHQLTWSEKVTLMLAAVVSCSPGTIGVEAASSAARSRVRSGVAAADSTIVVISPSDAARCLREHLGPRRASATALASAWRYSASALLELRPGRRPGSRPPRRRRRSAPAASSTSLTADTLFDAE